jgi:hypothetical protein
VVLGKCQGFDLVLQLCEQDKQRLLQNHGRSRENMRGISEATDGHAFLPEGGEARNFQRMHHAAVPTSISFEFTVQSLLRSSLNSSRPDNLGCK